VSVRAGGFTYADGRVQIGLLIIAPVAALFMFGLTAGGPTYETLPKAVVFIAILVTYELFVEGSISVRRVDVDASGVTFRYLFNREHGTWADLRPGRSPARKGMWVVVRVTKRGRRRGHWITLAQAEAILRHPSRPQWDFLPGVAESLGNMSNG